MLITPSDFDPMSTRSAGFDADNRAVQRVATLVFLEGKILPVEQLLHRVVFVVRFFRSPNTLPDPASPPRAT
jgi:hypothetical protein